MRNLIIRILLSPLALIYGLGVSLRNFFYSKNLLKGVEFDIPVISVGNLSVGGAGKTPHVEYLIRLLKDYLQIATLSRGYKRKTKGFRIAQPGDTVIQIGDEPVQFLKKFPEVIVSVAENRMFAIPEMITNHPEIQTILLDDAFQHRSVKPGLNILLTQYQLPFTRDWLLPSGRLREWRTAYRRADIIIISKCPDTLTIEEKNRLKNEINPLPNQRIYFSKYEYSNPYKIFTEEAFQLKEYHNVLVLSAIANTEYLTSYLSSKVQNVRSLEFEDHHLFTNYDISRMERIFSTWEVDNKIILTTEKDAARLELHKKYLEEHQLPIYIIPATVSFLEDDATRFNEDVKDFLLGFKV